MKKCIKYILFCLVLLIGFPIISFAASFKTGISDIVNNMPNTSFERLDLFNSRCQAYYSYGLGGKPAYQLSGVIDNGYEVDIDLTIHLFLYDADENVLGELTKDIQIQEKNTNNFSFLVSAASHYDFDFNLIAKYSYELEVKTDVEREESVVNSEYYFNDFNVDIKVSKDNIYSIEEKFDVVFKKHITAIKKEIPIRYIYKRDLNTVNKRSITSNIKIGDNYTEELVKGKNVLTIGEVDVDNTTKHYDIKYDYNVGKDTINKNDEFMYYINNTWNCKIDGASFKITLPKETNDIKVVLIDKDGYEIEDNFNYEINGNVITGSIDMMMEDDNLYGIKIILPDKYFMDATNNLNSISVISLIVPLICIVLAILVYYLLNNIKNIKNTSLYPYKNLNSIEFSYLYNGRIKESDIGTLLFNLCNDGYIDVVKNKDSYTIVKKKDYKNSNNLEKAFMDDMFKYTDQVDREQLQVAMRNMKERIVVRQDTKKNRKKLFTNDLFNFKLIFWLLVIVIFVLITINTLTDYQMTYLWVNLIVSGVGYGLLLRATVSRNNIMEKIIIALVSIVLIISPIIFTCLEAFKLNPLNIVVYIIGIICMIIIAIIANGLPNRTAYGRKVLNIIRSYKEYLLNVDMEVINDEIVNNRYYFYTIIPYALVLGIGDKWYNKFEKVELVKPSWYIDDAKKFDREKFYEVVREIYSDMFFAYKK